MVLSLVTNWRKLFVIKGMESMCEVVVSVPISKERLKERGYNQSELIAKKTANVWGVPYANCMIKTKAQFKNSIVYI